MEIQPKRVGIACAALLAFAPMQASAGDYIAGKVIERIITPADIAPPPTAGDPQWAWLLVPVVICLLVCFGSDDDGGTTIVEPPRPPEPPVEPPAPVPLPAGAILALTGLGALAALRRGKGK